MKKITVYVFTLMMLASFIIIPNVQAAEMNFAVQAITPENQVNKGRTYFDLNMKPKQEQDLKIRMKNDTEEPVTVEVGINTATTNDNGIADYNGKNKKKDSTLKYDLSELVTIDKEVTVPAKSEKTIIAHVKMPNKSFDGILLGGFTFIEKDKKDKKETEESAQIINKFAYTIGIQLQETEKTVKPELVLNDVKANQVNFRNVIQANIQNTESALIKDLTVEGQIFKKNGNKPLYEVKREDLRMAPNSNFNYGISLNNEEFKSGTYLFKGVATAGKQKWTFEKEFTIKNETAKKLNNTAVELKKDYSLYIYIGLGVLALVLLAVILILLKKLKANKKD